VRRSEGAHLLYLCNLRNLWLIKSVSVFGLNKRDARLVPQRNRGMARRDGSNKRGEHEWDALQQEATSEML